MSIGRITYLDVQELLSKYWRALIDWVSRPIEHSSQHFHTHGHFERVSCEFAGGGQVVDIRGAFKDLEESKLRKMEYLPVRLPVCP